MENKYLILPADPDDSRQIAELEKKIFSHPWSEQSVLNEIKDNDTVFLKCSYNDVVCGYISCRIVFPEAYIGNIAVTEEFRNRGVATNLLKEMIRIVKDKKCDFITLEVRKSNISAIHIYEKNGFIKQGERKNFYSAPNEDAIIYTLFSDKGQDQ